MVIDPEEELDRQITDDETKLWKEVKRRDESEPYETIRTAPAAKQSGLHPERGRQIARTWANDGLVQLRDPNGQQISLTEYGKKFEF